MILSCPACSTRFLVADAAFGATPRRVRCGQCRNEWMAQPPENTTTIDIVDTAIPQFEEVAPKPIPQGSNLPAPIVTPKKLLRRVAIAVCLLLGFAVLGTAALYRDDIIETAQAYLPGSEDKSLLIEDVKTRYAEENGGWVLVVEGNVRNKGTSTTTVPALSLLTKNKDGAVLGTYTPELQSTEVAAAGATSFIYTIREVSEQLAEVTVQFANP